MAITSNQVSEVLPALKAGGMILLADPEIPTEDFVDTSEWVGYVNDAAGYAISLPADWSIDAAPRTWRNCAGASTAPGNTSTGASKPSPLRRHLAPARLGRA